MSSALFLVLVGGMVAAAASTLCQLGRFRVLAHRELTVPQGAGKIACQVSDASHVTRTETGRVDWA
jgi:hypothetical protein